MMTSLYGHRGASSAINWQELHRRLEQARQASERAVEPDQVTRDRLLKERAASMARAASGGRPADATGPQADLLEFSLAGERYAVEAAYVAQVLPMLPITAVPGVPEYVVGIIATQGELLSVVDLRSFFNLPLSGLSEPAAIVVLKEQTMEFGILAERISGMARYPVDILAHGLADLEGAGKPYLKSVTAGRTAILDAARLLSDPRLIIEID